MERIQPKGLYLFCLFYLARKEDARVIYFFHRFFKRPNLAPSITNPASHPIPAAPLAPHLRRQDSRAQSLCSNPRHSIVPIGSHPFCPQPHQAPTSGSDADDQNAHNSPLAPMAGDHKCPVCGSTFTRSQHVARHMRSRPYEPPTHAQQILTLLSISRHGRSSL